MLAAGRKDDSWQKPACTHSLLAVFSAHYEQSGLDEVGPRFGAAQIPVDRGARLNPKRQNRSLPARRSARLVPASPRCRGLLRLSGESTIAVDEHFAAVV
jgi:hypothetical protein